MTDKEDWKFKADIEPIPATEDFWYMLGNYIKPEDLISDCFQLEEVKYAIATLESFQDALWDNDILEEC